jgi:glycosyltransferase involved in cell wall biosynthesis
MGPLMSRRAPLLPLARWRRDGPSRIGIDAHLLSFAATYRQAGVSRYIAELLRGLAGEADGAGGREYIAFAGPARPPAGFAPEGAVRWRHSRLPTERAPVRIAWEQGAGPIAAWATRLDLLHGPVNVLPLLTPCPGVVTVHDLAFLARPEAFHPAKRRYLRAMTALSTRRAARVIAVSAFTRDELVRRLGTPAHRITVVHNGVDPAFAPLPAGEVARFRAERGLPARVVLAVGTLEPRKNLVGLLQAFARLLPGGPSALGAGEGDDDLGLVVVGGKGWLYDALDPLVASLGLAGRVRFTGHVPDDELALWYNATDAFAYPSLYEGFGLPPLEALACGAPVVTSDSSSLPEVVGDAALLVDPRDPAALAAALVRILTEPALRATLRAAGPRQAAEFSWARTVAATRAVYDNVLTRMARQSGARGAGRPRAGRS